MCDKFQSIHTYFISIKKIFFFFFIFNDVYNDNYLFDAWVLNPMRLVYILFQSFFFNLFWWLLTMKFVYTK